MAVYQIKINGTPVWKTLDSVADGIDEDFARSELGFFQGIAAKGASVVFYQGSLPAPNQRAV